MYFFFSSSLFCSPHVVAHALLVAACFLLCVKKKKKPVTQLQPLPLQNSPVAASASQSNQNVAPPRKSNANELPKNVKPADEQEHKPQKMSKSDNIYEDKSGKKSQKATDGNRDKIDEKLERKIRAVDTSKKSRKNDDGGKKSSNEESSVDDSSSTSSSTDTNANEKSKSKKKGIDDKSKKKDAFSTKMNSEKPANRINGTSTNRGLLINPMKLHFTEKDGSGKLHLDNRTGKRLAVKIKSSDCKNYNYDPIFSFLEPDSTSTLTIERIAPTSKDEEMAVLSTEVPSDANDPEKFYKSLGVTLDDERITTTDIPMIVT